MTRRTRPRRAPARAIHGQPACSWRQTPSALVALPRRWPLRRLLRKTARSSSTRRPQGHAPSALEDPPRRARPPLPRFGSPGGRMRSSPPSRPRSRQEPRPLWAQSPLWPGLPRRRPRLGSIPGRCRPRRAATPTAAAPVRSRCRRASCRRAAPRPRRTHARGAAAQADEPCGACPILNVRYSCPRRAGRVALSGMHRGVSSHPVSGNGMTTGTRHRLKERDERARVNDDRRRQLVGRAAKSFLLCS